MNVSVHDLDRTIRGINPLEETTGKTEDKSGTIVAPSETFNSSLIGPTLAINDSNIKDIDQSDEKSNMLRQVSGDKTMDNSAINLPSPHLPQVKTALRQPLKNIGKSLSEHYTSEDSGRGDL